MYIQSGYPPAHEPQGRPDREPFVVARRRHHVHVNNMITVLRLHQRHAAPTSATQAVSASKKSLAPWCVGSVLTNDRQGAALRPPVCALFGLWSASQRKTRN